MVTRFIGVLSLLVAVVGYTSAEEPDMPLTRAKVGDWVLFKMDNPQSKMSMRMEVTEVTDKTVTIKSVTTINGMELPVDVKTMDKISKGDPAVEQRNRKEFNYVDTGKGQETLKINGKDYRCDWKSMTTTSTAGGVTVKTESKLWMSKDAPVYGMVRTETKSMGQTYVMELVDSGHK
jgi:hypothetical protein